MTTVKFFGLINTSSNTKELKVEGKSFKEVVEEILGKCPNITKKQLFSSIIFINKKQVAGKKSLNIKINEGDEIIFISPSSGG